MSTGAGGSLPDVIEVQADSTLVGLRLDRALASVLPGLSRTRIQAAILADRVRVNGHSAKAGMLVMSGMHIDVSAIVPPAPEEGIASDLRDRENRARAARPELDRKSLEPLAIVYEDQDLLVIDKPAGLVVHPAPGHSGTTLVDHLLDHAPELRLLADSGRPGIVHRLDKDTSGLLVVAKHPTAHANLAEQMKSHSTVKRYLALVEGKVESPGGVIDAPIGRDPRFRQRMAVVRVGGREARTRFRRLAYTQGRTLLEVQLESGRTHQIRVHMAAIGHPIVGDRVYGRIQSPQPPRQFLHAAHLEFRHPTSQIWMVFEAPLPSDLASFVAPWMPSSDSIAEPL